LSHFGFKQLQADFGIPDPTARSFDLRDNAAIVGAFS
jgi:hypothetical protein